MVQYDAPDGGWGWMVVIGCAIVNLLFGFVVRGFGVLYLMLQDQFKSSAVNTTLVGTSLLLSWGITGPISGFLLKKFTCRLVTMAGSLLATSGVLITGFAPSLLTTYFAYALTGCGLSLAFNAAYLCVGLYFTSKKSLAIGIGTMGSAIGTLICPPTMEYFFGYYGFSGGMIMTACVTMQGCVAACMFFPLGIKYTTSVKDEETYQKKVESGQQNGLSLEKNGFNSNEKSWEKKGITHKFISYFKLFCNPLLVSIIFMSFSIFSMYFLFSMVPALAIQNSVPQKQGAFLVTANAVFDGLAKIIVAPLFDLKRVRIFRPAIYAVLGILSGTAILLLPVCKSFSSLLVMSSYFGLMDGGIGGQRLTIISDLMEPEHLPDSLGLSVLFASLGSVLSSLYLGRYVQNLMRTI